jgi:hypothetical protein
MPATPHNTRLQNEPEFFTAEDIAAMRSEMEEASGLNLNGMSDRSVAASYVSYLAITATEES